MTYKITLEDKTRIYGLLDQGLNSREIQREYFSQCSWEQIAGVKAARTIKEDKDRKDRILKQCRIQRRRTVSPKERIHIGNLIMAGYSCEEIVDEFYLQYSVFQVAGVMAQMDISQKPAVPEEMRNEIRYWLHQGETIESIAETYGIIPKQVGAIAANEARKLYPETEVNGVVLGKRPPISGMQYFRMIREGLTKEQIVEQTGLSEPVANVYEAHLKMGTYQRKLEEILGPCNRKLFIDTSSCMVHSSNPKFD